MPAKRFLSENAGAIGAMGKKKVCGMQAHSHSHRHEATESESERKREREKERQRETDGSEPPTEVIPKK